MQNIREQVSKRIRELREKTGLTQERFAEATDLSVDVIGKIERAATTPSLETLEKIATGLEMSLSELLDFEEERVSELRQEVERLKFYLITKDLEDVRFTSHLIKEVIDQLEERKRRI